MNYPVSIFDIQINVNSYDKIKDVSYNIVVEERPDKTSSIVMRAG